jgi:hypothetical protein
MLLQMQSQVLVLEEEKKALDARVVQEHEQLEAATALHKVLSDKIQQVTTSLEQKCKDEVTKAEQKIAELQVKAGALSLSSVLCATAMHTPAVWLACVMTICLQSRAAAGLPPSVLFAQTKCNLLGGALDRHHCRALQQP